MSELDKRRLVGEPPVFRSKDALKGVEMSPLQGLTERSTVGPYNGELKSPELRHFLSDPANVIIALPGRNESQRKNLGPVIDYSINATNGHADSTGNVLYVDGNSTDDSIPVAQERGAVVISRADALKESIRDVDGFAEILGVTADSLKRSLNGQELPGDVPLRKGIDVTVARIALLKLREEGLLPRYIAYIDTDLKSIPGGQVAHELPEYAVYHPIEMMAQGILDLNSYYAGTDYNALAIFTGSQNRNNEPIMSVFGVIDELIDPDYHSPRQQAIGHALASFPGILVHPLTGELMVSSDAELDSMGATGQAVEVARILSLAGKQLEAYETADPDALENALPLVGNVRRGNEMRIDEPQIDEKEWWMIIGVLPSFVTTVASHAINSEKLPHEFNLEDYRKINARLARTRHKSRLDNNTQTRVFDQFPMERIVPPVTLLHKEGIIKI